MPRPFFVLQDGRAYATVGSNQASDVPNLAAITGIALSTSGGGNNNKPSQTPAPASKSDNNSKPSDSPSPTSTTPVTSIQTSVASGPEGISTIVRTTTLDPAKGATSSPSPASPQDGNSKSKVPIIVGCAVGIPLGLALIGIVAWLLRKRSRLSREHKALESPNPYSNSEASGFTGGHKLTGAGLGGAAGAAAMTEKNRHSAAHYSDSTAPDPGVPELMGQNVGPGRPVSAIKGKAELDGGPGFAAGAVPYTPDLVGVGGGNANTAAGTHTGVPTGRTPNSSWGSAPPGYSPGMNGGAFVGSAAGTHGNQQGGGYTGVPEGVAEAPDTSVPRRDGQSGAGVGGGAGNVTEGGRYIPYRPPVAIEAQGGGGTSNVPEGVAEMSSVRTPPE